MSDTAVLGPITGVLSSLLIRLRSLADAPLPSLIFLAVVLRGVGSHASPDSPWPKRVGFSALLGFCGLGFLSTDVISGETAPYLAIGIRALLLMLIAEGAAGIALPFLAWGKSLIARLNRSLRRGLAQARRSITRIFERPPTPETPPPSMPAPSLKDLIDQARKDFGLMSARW